MSKKDIPYKKTKRQLRTTFILITTLIMVLIVTITILLEWAVMNTGWVDAMFAQPSWLIAALAIGFTSVATGIGLSYIASRIIMKPLNDLTDGMSKLGKGKFDTRIYYKGPAAINDIYDGFNELARELQTVEILRSDFINNFSHEFKTPIMSINGLIGLIKDKDLPKDKRDEYLGIIEEETQRLTLITTNILNLTKIENQQILTDTTVVNVSEQIRTALLLLEKGWTQKNLELSMDCDEYYVEGNEDLLKQVWVNLFDNAIKFSDERGVLSVDIVPDGDDIKIKIGNDGPEIPEADREKIFGKFYRSDQSHSVSGNGIGLPIVKRIAELHGGSVTAGREENRTVFTVILPRASEKRR